MNIQPARPLCTDLLLRRWSMSTEGTVLVIRRLPTVATNPAGAQSFKATQPINMILGSACSGPVSREAQLSPL